MNYFLIPRKPNEKCIYYKDVIDKLCERDFKPNCDRCYMENTRQYDTQLRNQKSIKVYGEFWGNWKAPMKRAGLLVSLSSFRKKYCFLYI